MSEYTDKELLDLFSKEESKHLAFNTIMRKYREKVYWHVRRMLVDHEDTDDVVQNCFIKAWDHLDGFRGDSAIFTWLYRIASNEALSFLKKKKRRYFLPINDVESELCNMIDTDPLYTGDQIRKALDKAVIKLPERQRMVFNMKYYDEMKYEEMSQILGVTVGALKASYHHAVKKIEKELSED